MAEGYDSALWQAWREAEREVARQLLARAFGSVALELGTEWMADDLIDLCPARKRLRIAAKMHPGADAYMAPENLGIISDSVDAVLLPHTLEFVASPQAVLREADRVLSGEGHLLITGFNPWSTWTPLRFFMAQPVRSARLLSIGRLCDWLQLLGFEIVTVRRYFHRLPLNIPRLLEKLEPVEKWRIPPLPGCGYAILARKHIYGVTPLRMKRRWETDKVGGIVRPAMRTEQ